MFCKAALIFLSTYNSAETINQLLDPQKINRSQFLELINPFIFVIYQAEMTNTGWFNLLKNMRVLNFPQSYVIVN